MTRTPVRPSRRNPTTTATGGPFSYDVQVCANATCTTTIYDSANVPAPAPADDTDYVVSTPLVPGTYFWRVRTINNFTLASAFSAARSFTGELVGASEDEVTLAADGGVIAIPYSEIRRSNLIEE